MKCVDWIISEFLKNGVSWVVFCGDLFNSRYSINVNTLNIGIGIVQKLASKFEKVVLIEGNHDTYYKNSNSVNSISFMSDISQSDSVVIVDEAPKYAENGGKTIGFYPWGTTLEDASEEVPDYGFGHFEFNGAELVGSISSGCKMDLEDLFVFGKKLFSGHYHKPRPYVTSKRKTLEMVGSPLQLNWGDYGQDKRVMLLDVDTGETEDLIDSECAVFSKVYYSSFKEKKYDKSSLASLCTGNFVKFVVDMQYSFEDILKCSDIIKKLSPASLEFEYLISVADKDAKECGEEMSSCKSKQNDEYLMTYIDSVFGEYAKADSSLNLEDLKKMASDYFRKAMQPVDEREDVVLEDEH